MSFDLKLSLQQDTQNVLQHHKTLSRLIEQIEQQKIQLDMWQKAKDEILQHTRKTLSPIYCELHNILFQQLEQLWNSLQLYEFSKADITQLDEKIQNLANLLKNSQVLSEQHKSKVVQIDEFYQQQIAHSQAKKNKKKPNVDSGYSVESNRQHRDAEQAEVDLESYADDAQQYELQRELHRLNRHREKCEQAQKMAQQSLKTVYLKIVSIIHPDREQDQQLKIEKTAMLQQANEAYEQQDLFYLLKVQLQLEQNRGVVQKGLSNARVKFYKMALEAQKQRLDHQIDEIIQSLDWLQRTKFKIQKSLKPIHIADMYKKLAVDYAELKQQLKQEKERLKYMEKLKGLEVLLEKDIL